MFLKIYIPVLILVVTSSSIGPAKTCLSEAGAFSPFDLDSPSVNLNALIQCVKTQIMDKKEKEGECKSFNRFFQRMRRGWNYENYDDDVQGIASELALEKRVQDYLNGLY